jgi:hypothetical protein
MRYLLPTTMDYDQLQPATTTGNHNGSQPITISHNSLQRATASHKRDFIQWE